MQMLLSLHPSPSSPRLCFYLFNRKRMIVSASLLFVFQLLLLLLRALDAACLGCLLPESRCAASFETLTHHTMPVVR